MNESSTTVAPGAQPFYLAGNDIGLLLIHGFGGSIGDYRPFADQLHRQGYTVSGICLAGHGRGLAALATTTVEDWRQSVQQGIRDLQSRCRRIILLGASFGGALAINAAAQSYDQVAGVVAVNAPVGYRGAGIFQGVILRVLRLVTPYYPKLGLSAADRQRYARLGSTTAWPIDGILATRDFVRRLVVPCLPAVKIPAMIMANQGDPYVSSSSAKRLIDGLGTSDKMFVAVPGRTHRPFRDPALTQFMAETVTAFIKRVAPA